ncbi:MAG: mechanosensitive ion channel, partial [Muribaculaceae bacterium]|nr:mechanosensitive ion channel [Muribaculaceae bacterium]
MLQIEQIPSLDAEKLEKSSENALNTLKGLSFEDAISKIANGVVDFTFRLFLAILVFYVGKLIINKLFKMVRNIMIKQNVDASLTTFVLSLIRITLYFILIIIVIGLLGIETSSFIALFASAGVAIGMALSGTLQNFAGGVLILLLKPYKVGNYIEAQGYAGTVKDINIFNTVINTPDNKSIIIPNGGLSTSSINNYSLENYRRVDWTISLSYSTDFSKAKEAILAMLSTDSRIVKQYMEADRLERKQQILDSDE